MAGTRGPWSIFLLINDLDSHGGASRLMCTLAAQLRRAGHDACVYTEYPPADGNQYASALLRAAVPLNAGVDDLPVGGPRGGLWSPVQSCATVAEKLIRPHSPERSAQRVRERLGRSLTHYLFGQRARRAFTTAVTAARQQGRRVLVHVHRGVNGLRWAAALQASAVYLENSTPSRRLGVDWWWRGLQAELRHARLVIAGSSRAARAVREYLDYRGPIATLPWMVDEAPTDGSPRSTETRRPLVVGAAGRLYQEKGHAFLIRALPQVLKTTPVRCLIAGDGLARAALSALAAELGVQEQVDLLGLQNEEGMAHFWDRIDLMVLPSLLEGSPLVLLEAMARRVPVVATDVGGVRELLDDGRCGHLVPPRDSAALAEAVVTLAADSNRRLALAECGYQRFRTRHAPAVALPSWLDAYAAVLAESAAGP